MLVVFLQGCSTLSSTHELYPQEVSSVTYKTVLRLPLFLLEIPFLTSYIEKFPICFPENVVFFFTSVYVLMQKYQLFGLIQITCELDPSSHCVTALCLSSF